MTWVFDHAWMTGVFGDRAVAAHLSAEVQLAHMLHSRTAVIGESHIMQDQLGAERYELLLDLLTELEQGPPYPVKRA